MRMPSLRASLISGESLLHFGGDHLPLFAVNANQAASLGFDRDALPREGSGENVDKLEHGSLLGQT